GEVHGLLGPIMRMAGLAFERLDPGDAGHGRRRENADGGNQEARAIASAILQQDLPAARLFPVMRYSDAALELDVAGRGEFVGETVEGALGLVLRREMLGPIPFLQQFLRKVVAVGPAFGIEAGARIAVPVPGSADIGAVL